MHPDQLGTTGEQLRDNRRRSRFDGFDVGPSQGRGPVVPGGGRCFASTDQFGGQLAQPTEPRSAPRSAVRAGAQVVPGSGGPGGTTGWRDQHPALRWYADRWYTRRDLAEELAKAFVSESIARRAVAVPGRHDAEWAVVYEAGQPVADWHEEQNGRGFTLADLVAHAVRLLDEGSTARASKRGRRRRRSAEPSAPKRRVSSRQRFEILRRDDFRCQLCGRSAEHDGVKLHVDHQQPRSKGGGDEDENLWTLCSDCNLGKSDQLVAATGG